MRFWSVIKSIYERIIFEYLVNQIKILLPNFWSVIFYFHMVYIGDSQYGIKYLMFDETILSFEYDFKVLIFLFIRGIINFIILVFEMNPVFDFIFANFSKVLTSQTNLFINLLSSKTHRSHPFTILNTMKTQTNHNDQIIYDLDSSS